MDIRRARTFVTVAELGSVSRAADRLHVAQPALSRQLASLEEELGLRLFDRIGRRLALTGEGEQILGDCRTLLNYASAVGDRAQLLRRGDSGTLKVAASPQFIEGAFAGFLHGYARKYPNVRVKLFESGAGSDTLRMLERGEIHIGQNLLSAVRSDNVGFAHQVLATVELLATCEKSLRLGKTGTVGITELADHPLLLMDASFTSRRTFDAACRLAGVEVNIAFESRTPHTLLAMAEKGHGVAVVPSAVRIDRYPLRVVRILHGGKAIRESVALFWDKRRPLAPYATAFCAMLAKYVNEAFPISRPTRG